MITSKTTKMLSLILPITLLISANVFALDAEVESKATSAVKQSLNVAFQTLKLVAGIGLISNVRNSLSELAHTQVSGKKDIFVAKKADVENLALAENALLPNELTKENLEAVARNKGDLNSIKFEEKATTDCQVNNGWKNTFKTKLNLRQNPLCPNSNIRSSYAPLVGGIALVASGLNGLKAALGCCGNAQEDVE
jgi:hypothetical protein